MAPFRDTLLPLLSLRGLLGFTGRAERADREKIVVTRVGGALVGLLADRMRSIFPADADLIEKIPPVLSARAGGEAKISAIYRGENGRRLVSVLAPAFFREDVMQRLKTSIGSTREGDKEAPASQREERQFLVFTLGDDEFGLPIEAVDEVARVPDQITRLPRPEVPRRCRQPAGRGAAGGRPAAALRHAGAGRARPVPPGPGRTERHKAGLIVDSVSEVLRCPADEIEPAPSLSNETVKLVHGVVNLEQAGRIVLLLDPAELLTRAERGLLDTFRAKAERAGL